MGSLLDTLSLIGWALILLGVALVLLPLMMKALGSPKLELLQPWLIYIYRGERFTFVTSPLLILLSLFLLLLRLVR